MPSWIWLGFYLRKDIHPEQYEVVVSCACGNRFNTHSTTRDIKLTLCSACHPYFTGAQKFVDTAGRIEKFKKKFGK